MMKMNNKCSIYCTRLEQTLLLRQNILKKLLPRLPFNLELTSTIVLFYWLNESSRHGRFNRVFFLKNSKYLKSYNGKTKILKKRPFLENFIPSSPCYY